SWVYDAHFSNDRNYYANFFGSGLLALQVLLDARAGFQQREEDRVGQALHVLVPVVQHFEEGHRGLEALAHVRGRTRIRVVEAFQPQRGRRVAVASAAAMANEQEELPDVLAGPEVLGADAEHVDHADESEALQLLEAGAHIGAGDGEIVGDLLGGKGALRKI